MTKYDIVRRCLAKGGLVVISKLLSSGGVDSPVFGLLWPFLPHVGSILSDTHCILE